MGFELCHPAVNMIYFTAVIYGMICFRHPVFLAISFLSAVAYSIKRNGMKAVIFDAILLPLTGAFALYFSTYNHFGVTVIEQNLIGNSVTLESLIYGVVIGLTVSGAMIWFSCIYSVFTSDKVVYLFGKASPKLSLFLSILLRMVPRIKNEAKKINTAQQGIGRGVNQGNLFARIRNCIRIFSIMITWIIDSLSLQSESMQSRGSLLRGRKAFSIYRFDNRDRAYVIAMFANITLTVMGVMLKQTEIVYDPKIIITPITSVSYLFYTGYAVLCLMPLGLELYTEYRFRMARETIT
jgi:energy-coupling factor transport system permease protein